MKHCPRCGHGCQNKYEHLCGDCATAEAQQRLGMTEWQRQRDLALLRLDPFAFAAEFANRTSTP